MSLFVSIKKDLGDFKLNIEFEMNGGILGFLGSSGCGKSYTLKCIAGIETPDEGKIILDGITLFDSEKKINLPPQKRHVGYLFQNYALFPNMTVEQNILCGLVYEKDKRAKRLIYDEVIELLKLQGLEKHKPHQLSGGQAQRAALARILVNRPKILLLDEPFSALDTHLRLKLQLEMKSLLQEINKDIIMVTHSRDEAYHMCRDIAVISDGSIIVQKATKELFADPERIEAARITGCKNIIPAVKTGEHEVTVPAWGNITFTVKSPVKDSVKAVGLRAHYFNAATPHNRFEVVYSSEMEELFEMIILFRYKNQDPAANDVWWRIPKDRRPSQTEFPDCLGIAPANILLLE